MAGRRNYYFKQLVQEGELDAGFAALEAADWAMMADIGLTGIVANAVVTQHAGTPDLTVDVSGSGIVYDPLGKRISIVALQNVNCAVDSLGASTNVVTPGNEKWVSIFIKYKKLLSDPRIDGNSNTVFFVEDEGFEFVVVQGAEAAIGAGVRPALDPTAILLADVQRLNGQTQILTATHISGSSGSGFFSSTRRQDAFVYSAGALSVRVGTPEASDAALLTLINSGILASTVSYAGSGNWADATTVSAANVEAAIDEVVSDLAGTSGANKIGCSITNLWNDSTGIAGANLDAAIEEIVSDLGSQSASVSGARKIGFDVTGLNVWADATTLSAASVHNAIHQMIGALGGTSGSLKIGAVATAATFADGTAAGGTSVDGLIESIVSLLGDSVGVGANGARRIGFAAQGNIAASNVEGALAELDTEKAKVTDVQIFTASGTWTKPTSPSPLDVYVYAIGGGGGGGSGRRGAAATARGGGGGGAGAGKSYAHFRASDLGSSATVTIGQGGAGAPAASVDNTNGTSGTSGTNTTFGSLVRAGGGVAGAGGTTGAVAGGLGGSGDFDGGDGGSASDGTTAATAGGSTAAAGGGGGGGGISAGNVDTVGAAGGTRSRSYDASGAGTSGPVNGGAGGTGGSVTANIPNGGAGGGGGGGNDAGVGGTGGNGGLYGGGGGGGGASVNGSNSGAGGAGQDGIVVVISHF